MSSLLPLKKLTSKVKDGEIAATSLFKKSRATSLFVYIENSLLPSIVWHLFLTKHPLNNL
jgi:hypothetical protein